MISILIQVSGRLQDFRRSYYCPVLLSVPVAVAAVVTVCYVGVWITIQVSDCFSIHLASCSIGDVLLIQVEAIPRSEV